LQKKINNVKMMKTRLFTVCYALLLSAACALAEDYTRYYTDLPVDVKQVTGPQIPDRSVCLTDFGAVGNGLTLCTDAFARAIAALESQGGGRLVVPEGVWLTGPIELKSNIDLHLEQNALIYFSPDKRLYTGHLDSRGRCMPCISADGCHDIAITGKGTIDGNGGGWHYAKRSKMSDVEWNLLLQKGGYVTDDGLLWYAWQLTSGYPDIAETPQKQEKMRNDLVKLTSCRRVLLSGPTFQNSPRFHIHPFYCEDLIIDGITVRCPWNVQNGDGIDLTDCHRVLLVNTTVDVGDDGICLKSDRPEAGRISGNEDFLIQSCKVCHAHGGFVLGSNIAAGMRRIVCRHSTFTQTDTGLRFKSFIGRGGKTEQMFISDIMMSDIVHEAIVFHCDYADQAPGDTKKLFLDPAYVDSFSAEDKVWTPDFQDIHIDRIVCRGANTGIKASGLTGLNCVHDIYVRNSLFVYNSTAQDIHEPTAKIKLTDVTFVPNSISQ
jgi:polygalacturonase